MKKKVGFIAGSFDIIHPGYIYMFEEAKKNCDYLIVGLHTDPTLEKKNKLKSILSIEEREKILLSLKFVNKVIRYDFEKDLLRILDSNNIDIRFLGDDYKNVKFTGDDMSIPIFWIDRSHGWSTTKFKKLIALSLQ